MDSLELVYRDDVVQIYWDTGARYHVAECHGFPRGQKLRCAAHACLSAARERGSDALLADVADLTEIDSDDQTWITGEFYPLLARNGVRRLAFVLPAAARTETTLRRMNASSRRAGLAFDYYATRAEAVQALAGGAG